MRAPLITNIKNHDHTRKFWESEAVQNRLLCLEFAKRIGMNELPIIGSLCLRTDLQDRYGANVATH